jgi:predicted MFS family arabinose efflux permease
MAAVLYEPAFTVLAKWFPEAWERRRAMTALTLVAALASFIFLPLSQGLIDAHGWRHALVILAVILAIVTVPLHAVVLRPARTEPRSRHEERGGVSTGAGRALRSASFWRLSSAFCLATLTGIAMTVHAIPFLLQRGYGAGFAAFVVGLVGISQVPGRLLFAAMAGRLSSASATASVCALIAAGVALVVSIDTAAAAVTGLVVLGMGNGMATLSRATGLADLYGAAQYGTIAGVTAAMTTAARGIGPFAAAVWAAAFGYDALLWTLVALSAAAAALAYRA